MKGKAIILSAPSGAGKTTIVKHLLGLDLGLEFSISSCSRAPRANEKHGQDYYFITETEFRKKIEKHIKNTYLRELQAPAGVKPTLKAWMELN